MPRRSRSRAARATALVLSVLGLFACLAPQHPPAATTPAETPYETMSAAIAMGKPEDALRSYEQSLAEHPQSDATRVLHGRLLMIAGKLGIDLVSQAEPLADFGAQE